MIYNYGDIVLVPFPFTNHKTMKKRPAVIISSKVYNQKRPDIVLMAITSQKGTTAHFGDVTLSYWKEAGLLKPSLIKSVFATVEKGLILKKLGRLSEKDSSSLLFALKTILGDF